MKPFTNEDYEKLIRMLKAVSSGEFDNMSDEELKYWFDFVQPMVSKKQFGNLYFHAIVLLVAHKLKMSGYGENTLGDLGKIGNSFAATSVSDGGSSISFASSGGGNTQSDAEYALTVYGVQYLQLRKMCVIPIHVSGEGDAYVRV